MLQYDIVKFQTYTYKSYEFYLTVRVDAGQDNGGWSGVTENCNLVKPE